jgi:hypothetical protein
MKNGLGHLVLLHDGRLSFVDEDLGELGVLLTQQALLRCLRLERLVVLRKTSKL